MCWGWNSYHLLRFQKLTLGDDRDKLIFETAGLDTPNLNMYSGRLNFGWNGLSLRGEYVHKSKDLNLDAVDGMASNGSAIYAEAGYNLGGFSTIISRNDKLVNANIFENDNIHTEHIPREAFSLLAYFRHGVVTICYLCHINTSFANFVTLTSQQREDFSQIKRNEPSSIPSSFASNLIFNFV